MALEPEAATGEAGPNPELVDFTRRFWIGLALAVPVLALEMGGHLFGLTERLGQQTSNWIQFALATPVVLWGGWPFFVRGYRSVVSRNLNMFTLIALGTGVAWLFSVVATLLPGAFPAAFRDAHGSVPVYYEPAAVIVVLVLLGQMLELRARDRTGNAVRALLNLSPKTARRLRDGHEEEVPLDAVAAGDLLRVRRHFGADPQGLFLKRVPDQRPGATAASPGAGRPTSASPGSTGSTSRASTTRSRSPTRWRRRRS